MFTSRTAGARIYRAVCVLREAMSLGAAFVTLAPLAIGAGAVVAGVLTDDSSLAMFAVGVVATLLLLTLAAIVSSGSIRRIVAGYRIREWVVIDTVDAEHPYVHHRRNRLDIGTMRAGLRGIWVTYRSQSCASADGRGDAARDSQATSPQYECGESHEEADCLAFPLYFEGPQPHGKEIHVEIAQNIYESPCAARSWVSKTIAEPIDRLEIRVKIPATAWPLDLEGRQVIPGQDRVSTLDIDVDVDDLEARLTVPHPVFGREYGIAWTRRPAGREPATGRHAASTEG